METPSSEEILSGIREWVEVESPTSHVEGVERMMDMVSQTFRGLGASVERIPGSDGRASHVAAASPWGADAKGILVLSHLDTVHPVGTLGELPYRVEGDKAYGPGIYDMKGGAYLGLTAYRTLAEAGVETALPIRFLYVSDEEVGSPTSRRHIEAAGEKAKYVLVTEPARDGGKIVTARRGSARFRIAAQGRAAHSGGRHADGRSAILEMARQVVAIESRTDYERGFSVNVGTIRGGSAVNVIPERCEAYLDMRFNDLDTAKEMIAWAKSLKSHDPDIMLTVEGDMMRPPFAKTPAIEALYAQAREIAADIGFELVDSATGGGSDGNFLADRLPVLDGLGVDGEGAHTLHEHLYVSSLVPRMRLMRGLLETLR